MTTATPRTSSSDWPIYVILALGAAIAVSDGALYAATRVVGDRPTPGSPSALVRALQAGYRPTTPVLVLAAVLLLVLLTAAVTLALWWTGRPKRGTSGSARWASRKDLASLIVGKDPLDRVGRIGLGEAVPKGFKLAAPRTHSVLVLGPPGSGKTESVVIPTLRDWAGPAVVTSVKPDILDATAARRAQVGEVWIFDPTESTGKESAKWSPLASCTTWAGAWEMATWLVDAAAPPAGSGGEVVFFTSQGRMLLAPLLYAAGAGGGTMADVVRWAQLQEAGKAREYLEKIRAKKGDNVDEASNALTHCDQQDGRTRGNIYATVVTTLEVYADPATARSADGCDIHPAELLDSATTLYLVSPVHAQARLAPLIEALIMSIVREAQNRAQAGRVLDPSLLLLLDEAGNVAPLRALPAIASTGRAQGVQLVSCWQDAGQVEHRYGRLAPTVMSNHSVELVLRGVRDLNTLDHVSRLLGDAEVDRHSVTDRGDGGKSTSTSQQRERLAPADQLRQLPVGHAVMIAGALPPVMVRFKLTPH
jgi:type IV secretion system protein VirD4